MISSRAQKLSCFPRIMKTHTCTSVLSNLLPVLSMRRFSDDPETKTVVSKGEKPKVHSTMPQHHLTYIDKITLRLFGNIQGEIPSEVSYPVMEKAESKRRIAVNLFLVAFCGLGSMFVVFNVKKNLKNETEGNVYDMNVKRYQQTANEKK